MEFWPEFLATSWGREFVAGGLGGMAGVIAGHPLDTLRIRIQQPVQSGSINKPTSARLLRHIISSEGPSALYRGMAAPLASVAFQNAVVFQVYAILSRYLDSGNALRGEPPGLKSVALAGVGTGALQSLLLCPVDLVKIRLQLQTAGQDTGPASIAARILRKEGIRGLYRGLSITVLRDAPAHGVYFWTYEMTREALHEGCRMTGEETIGTMLVAGGTAGVASWVCCYPLDVIKSRLQAQSQTKGEFPPVKYRGIVDCLKKSVREEGYRVLWRGLGTAVARAFVVNGAIFSAYELALRFLANHRQRIAMEES
ncbi:mitochondrial substrate carrier family protein [Wolffia australiana]